MAARGKKLNLGKVGEKGKITKIKIWVGAGLIGENANTTVEKTKPGRARGWLEKKKGPKSARSRWAASDAACSLRDQNGGHGKRRPNCGCSVPGRCRKVFGIARLEQPDLIVLQPQPQLWGKTALRRHIQRDAGRWSRYYREAPQGKRFPPR